MYTRNDTSGLDSQTLLNTNLNSSLSESLIGGLADDQFTLLGTDRNKETHYRSNRHVHVQPAHTGVQTSPEPPTNFSSIWPTLSDGLQQLGHFMIEVG